MNALIATVSTIQLFAPVLIAAGTAVGVSVLGRTLARRNVDQALAEVGGPWTPLHADVSEGTIQVAEVPALNFEASVTLLLNEAETSLVAARAAVISAADSASMTLRAKRVYLDASDLVEC